MEKQPTVAELRFTEQGVNLYGTVMEMSVEDITVRLHSGPAPRGLFAVDNAVDLVVVAKNTMFMATTQILRLDNGLLQLGFSSPVRTIQRRKEQRVAIELDISFRPIQDRGCYGLWKHGLSRDISGAGMCLLIAPGLDVPSKIEVLFMLPEMATDAPMSKVLCGDDGIEMLKMIAEDRLQMLHTASRDRPVKATAQVRNRRMQSDGALVLGLTFTLLSPADQIRLARFLTAPMRANA